MKSFLYIANFALCMLLCAGLITSEVEAAGKRTQPFNRVVVLLDASGSYQRRQNDAIMKTERLLDGMSGHRAKRWEQADEIKIISLDAIPEVIWEGTPEELSKIDKGDWAKRFKARQDYASCTDVIAGLELAATLLEASNKAGGTPTEKYLFAFSDFIHEPPTESPTKCQAPKQPSVPGKDFAWDRFADVKLAVFWMPPAQKMAWDRVMKAQGLTGYRLFTTAESAVAKLDIPDTAKRKVTAAERQEGRQTLSNVFSAMFGIAGAGLVLIALSGVGVALVMMMRRRRQSVGAPALVGRATAGPIAPMRMPRNPN